MLIKCTKCGFENQMGAIFCRGCGEKIDMNAMDPDTLAKNQNKGSGKAWKIIRKLIVFIILLALIGIFAAAFTTYKLPTYTSAPDSAKKTAEAKIAKIGVEKVNWLLPETKFTMDELNYLLKNRLFSAKKEEAAPAKADAKAADASASKSAAKGAAKDAAKSAAKDETAAQAEPEASATSKIMDNLKKKFVIHNVMAASAGKNMTVIIYATAFGYIPLRFEITGMLQPSESLPVNFTAQCGKINYLPLPGILCEKAVVKKLAPFFNNAELERILKRTSGIEMDGKELKLKFEKNNTTEKK